MKRSMLVGVAAMVASLALSGPAHASAPAPVVYPLEDAVPGDGVTYVQIEGEKSLWGTRYVAANISRQVAGLRIYRRGTCADRPWAACISVEVGHYEASAFGLNFDWHGLAWWGDPRFVKINLNTKYGVNQGMACHELLHALGLDHHNQATGCLSPVVHSMLQPSPWEMESLRAYYDSTRPVVPS